MDLPVRPGCQLVPVQNAQGIAVLQAHQAAVLAAGGHDTGEVPLPPAIPGQRLADVLEVVVKGAGLLRGLGIVEIAHADMVLPIAFYEGVVLRRVLLFPQGLLVGRHGHVLPAVQPQGGQLLQFLSGEVAVSHPGHGLSLRRRGGKGHADAAHQYNRRHYGGQGPFLHLHNRTNPFFNGTFAEGAGKGAQPALLRLHGDQGHGVGGPLVPPEPGHHRLVAAQLDIPVGQDQHGPGQGVEPVDAGRRRQNKLGEAVQPPDVDQLVLQHVVQPLPVGGIEVPGQQDHRMEQAVGQGRGHPVRLAQGDPPPQPVPAALPQLLPHRQSGPVLPAAAEVGEEEEAPAYQRTRQPDHLPEGDCGRAGDRLCLCAGQDREDSDSRPRRRRHRGRHLRRPPDQGVDAQR